MLLQTSGKVGNSSILALLVSESGEVPYLDC